MTLGKEQRIWGKGCDEENMETSGGYYEELLLLIITFFKTTIER